MRLTYILYLSGLIMIAPIAQAQSTDFRIEPELLVVPTAPTRGAQSVVQMTRERDLLLPKLQKTLERIDAKIAALKTANLTYKYIIPMDRTRASQQLLTMADELESRDTRDLRRCLLNQSVLSLTDYQKDHSECRDEAAEAWSTSEIQKNSSLRIALEALVFRSREDLSALQVYERELGISRLAYATEIRHFSDRTATLEYELIAQNPSFQCGVSLGTVRLDEPSTLDGQPIPTPLRDVQVQNQGPLGTCYANAASVALEAVTAKPNSALDLAIRYSMQGTKQDREISADFGGSFCGAIQIANREGLCERRDSWIEEASVQSDKITASSMLALRALHQFIGRRSTLPRRDWQILETVAPTLIPQILEITAGRPLTPIETPVVRNLGSLITGWASLHRVPKSAAETALRELRKYDYAHAEEYLPRNGNAHPDQDQAAARLYRDHRAPIIQVMATAMPQLSRTYLESQAEPFLRQGFGLTTGTQSMEKVRAALETHQAIQSALETQAQACSDRDLVEQLLIEVLSLAELSRKAQPESPLNAVSLAQSLFSTSTQNINSALLDTVAPKCQVRANRLPIQPVGCQEHRPRDTRFLETKLLQSLRHGRPIGMSYCAEVLGKVTGPVSQQGGCGGHESLLTGIRYNPQTQRCDVLVWNSWGKATGKTWIDTQRLLPYVMGLQELSAPPAAR